MLRGDLPRDALIPATGHRPHGDGDRQPRQASVPRHDLSACANWYGANAREWSFTGLDTYSIVPVQCRE